jgi:hypothetical protein
LGGEHYQYRMGLYDEEEFARERDGWKVLLNSARGIRAQWCRSGANFSAAFARELNGLLASPCEQPGRAAE